MIMLIACSDLLSKDDSDDSGDSGGGTTPLSTPSLSIQSATKDSLTIMFSGGGSIYELLRGSSLDEIVGYKNVVGDSYIDTGLQQGTTYYYKAKALANGHGSDSAFSEVYKGTTLGYSKTEAGPTMVAFFNAYNHAMINSDSSNSGPNTTYYTGSTAANHILYFNQYASISYLMNGTLNGDSSKRYSGSISVSGGDGKVISLDFGNVTINNGITAGGTLTVTFSDASTVIF